MSATTQKLLSYLNQNNEKQRNLKITTSETLTSYFHDIQKRPFQHSKKFKVDIYSSCNLETENAHLHWKYKTSHTGSWYWLQSDCKQVTFPYKLVTIIYILRLYEDFEIDISKFRQSLKEIKKNSLRLFISLFVARIF